MSYLCYLCLFVYIDVQHILCCVFSFDFLGLCCQFLRIFHFFLLPLRFSLTFIHLNDECPIYGKYQAPCTKRHLAASPYREFVLWLVVGVVLLQGKHFRPYPLYHLLPVVFYDTFVHFCIHVSPIRFIIYSFGNLYSIQHYVIKFVNDLRQVSGFIRVLRFPPPIKLTATI